MRHTKNSSKSPSVVRDYIFLNTKGNCLLCSESCSPCNSEEQSRANLQTSINFCRLSSRYLGFNLEKIVASSLTTVGKKGVQEDEKKVEKIAVELCDRCLSVANAFCQVHFQLQFHQMLLDRCVRSLTEVIRDADKKTTESLFPLAKEGPAVRKQHKTFTRLTAGSFKSAANLRKKLYKKSLAKLSRAFPVIKMKRICKSGDWMKIIGDNKKSDSPKPTLPLPAVPSGANPQAVFFSSLIGSIVSFWIVLTLSFISTDDVVKNSKLKQEPTQTRTLRRRTISTNTVISSSGEIGDELVIQVQLKAKPTPVTTHAKQSTLSLPLVAHKTPPVEVQSIKEDPPAKTPPVEVQSIKEDPPAVHQTSELRSQIPDKPQAKVEPQSVQPCLKPDNIASSDTTKPSQHDAGSVEQKPSTPTSSSNAAVASTSVITPTSLHHTDQRRQPQNYQSVQSTPPVAASTQFEPPAAVAAAPSPQYPTNHHQYTSTNYPQYYHSQSSSSTYDNTSCYGYSSLASSSQQTPVALSHSPAHQQHSQHHHNYHANSNSASNYNYNYNFTTYNYSNGSSSWTPPYHQHQAGYLGSGSANHGAEVPTATTWSGYNSTGGGADAYANSRHAGNSYNYAGSGGTSSSYDYNGSSSHTYNHYAPSPQHLTNYSPYLPRDAQTPESQYEKQYADISNSKRSDFVEPPQSAGLPVPPYEFGPMEVDTNDNSSHPSSTKEPSLTYDEEPQLMDLESEEQSNPEGAPLSPTVAVMFPEIHWKQSVAPGPRVHCTHPGCPEQFLTKVQLQLHLRTHGSFQCHFCQLKYVKAHWLGMHEKIKHGTNQPTSTGKIKCPRCDFTSTSQFKYLIHFIADHLHIPVHEKPCEICNKPFVFGTKVITRRNHFKSYHDIDGKDPDDIFTCRSCSAPFLKEAQYRDHQTHCVPPPASTPASCSSFEAEITYNTAVATADQIVFP